MSNTPAFLATPSSEASAGSIVRSEYSPFTGAGTKWQSSVARYCGAARRAAARRADDRIILQWGWLVALALLCATLAMSAHAQKPPSRIAYFSPSSVQSNAEWLAAFHEGMKEHGRIEERDYSLNARYGNDATATFEKLATELISSRPDVLLTSGDVGAQLFHRLTSTVPIVFAIVVAPFANGLVRSLQRPGGNATGLTSLGGDLAAKRVQLFKEAFPRITQIVMMFEPENVSSTTQAREMEQAARRLNIRIARLELRQVGDLSAAFQRGAALGAQAYFIPGGFFINNHTQAIAEELLRARRPAMLSGMKHVEAGVLMSYAPSLPDNFRRAAGYVDKILKGAKPSELPIEQPLKIELGINMKTAKAIGVTIPQSVLLRADRVIE
jgi:putative tryptophan/tyrosine transport system substrate-binding protein